MKEQREVQGFRLSEVIIIVLITCTFSILAGISYGRIKYSDSININSFDSKEDDDTALNEFITNYKYIIKNSYNTEDIDEDELLNKALASVLKELGIKDPYSLYMDEESYSEFNITLNGEYQGIGIGASKESPDEYLKISYIIEGSPASSTNLKAGDYIISIDGKSSKNMTAQEFSQYVISSDDEQFLLKIQRDEEEFSLNIKKGKVELSSTTSKVIERDGKKIGYIKLSIFAANTYNQFKKDFSNLEKQEIDSLIIDVRDNTGGHLTEVNKILSLFLSKDKIIYRMQKNNGKAVKYYSNGSITKKYPIVFISNNNTASASEVFILGLKENINAKVVGEKTYGKGTVQELIELSNGDKYKITTKRWLSPKGNWVNDTKGIAPDVEVKLSDNYLKNPVETNDNQLEEAIKLSIKEINK